MALDMILEIAENKRSIFSKNSELLKSVIDQIYIVIPENEPQEEQEEENFQDTELDFLENLCLFIPKKNYKLIM